MVMMILYSQVEPVINFWMNKSVDNRTSFAEVFVLD